MAELSEIEIDVVVAMVTTDIAAWVSTDIDALIGVSAASAEAALWALVAEDPDLSKLGWRR